MEREKRLESAKKYRDKNREKILAADKIYRAAVRIPRRKEQRLEVLRHYSNGEPKCVCCGEDTYEFLALDHIENGGNQHRKKENINGGRSMIEWIRKNDYPPLFQVLCHNCNSAKYYHKGCPHNKIS